MKLLKTVLLFAVLITVVCWLCSCESNVINLDTHADSFQLHSDSLLLQMEQNQKDLDSLGRTLDSCDIILKDCLKTVEKW